MRFPAGETFNLHKKVYPKGVLDKIDTGYVRFTVEDNGLNDYYILFRNQEMVGALCEFVDGKQLCSKEALDHILKLDTEGLAETVMYTEDVIDTIKKEHPELFLSPETTEKFKVGSTVFTGALRSVKHGDLLEVLAQLETQKLVGCLRVTKETEDAVHEGAVLFLETPSAALLESGHALKLGDDALREIALAFTEGKVYILEKKEVEDFLFFNNASRLKSPVEETIASEKAAEDLKRFMALKQLGLERGTLVLNAPCNGTFSFEALLRSTASRKFDGYLWVRSEHSRGLLVMVGGNIQAAYAAEGSGEVTGAEALRKIYNDMEATGAVDFYQLSSPPQIAHAFETEGVQDDALVKKLLGEMGQDLMKEVTIAKEFKKKWKDKREQQGE